VTPASDMKPMAYWLALARELEYPSWAWIDGRRDEGSDDRQADVISPRDGSTLTRLPLCDDGDVDRAVASARAAFEDGRWSRTSPAVRRQVLSRLAELIECEADRLALMETLDMGKPIANTRGGDVPGTAETFSYFAEAIDKHFGEVVPIGDDGLALVTRER
jgi:acyl-CoA reductase-like NAD-dependent aldehyde dehydrogenase